MLLSRLRIASELLSPSLAKNEIVSKKPELNEKKKFECMQNAKARDFFYSWFKHARWISSTFSQQHFLAPPQQQSFKKNEIIANSSTQPTPNNTQQHSTALCTINMAHWLFCNSNARRSLAAGGTASIHWVESVMRRCINWRELTLYRVWKFGHSTILWVWFWNSIACVNTCCKETERKIYWA